MPRRTMRAVYIGATSAAVLEAVPDVDAGFLIRAVIAWALRDELPAEVPPHLALAWKLIEHESRTMHEQRAEVTDELHEKRAAAGRKGAEVTNAAKVGKSRQTRQNPANEANPAKAAIETETETEKSPASAGDARAREGAFEPCEDCPAPEANVRATARHIGMPDAELQSWRDYWTMREWRADPRSARPMTPAGVLASLRRWHAEEGIRAAKQAHLDAKADERALAVAAARDERRTPAVTDYDAIERAKELAWARSPVVNLDELDKLAGNAKKEA